MKDESYLKKVREQYENFPYPQRDPENEKKTLLGNPMDHLVRLNHYCFKGKLDFDSFRVLIAGDGTGDASIFLAEQLRETSARIVALDISEASMAVAKERAKVRGLENIEWVHHSLLELPSLEMEFDYICCRGVLHHLESPEEGLRSIKSALAPGGALGIMLYGQYGRTGIYQVQDLMRLISGDEPDIQVRVEDTKKILDSLPPSNWLKHAMYLAGDFKTMGDVGVYDLFLHSQDRAYTTKQVYEYVESCGLRLVAFADPKHRIRYMPEAFIGDPQLLSKIKALPIQEQQAISELITGNIAKHIFYASESADTVASPLDLDNIPYWSEVRLDDLHRDIDAASGKAVGVKLPIGIEFTFMPGRYSKLIFEYMNDRRSLKDIFRKVRKKVKKPMPSDEELLKDFLPVYETLNRLDVILLRHRSSARLTHFSELHDRVRLMYGG